MIEAPMRALRRNSIPPIDSSHSSGRSIACVEISTSFTSPLRPSRGIHEIMRITLLVQKGTVQTMKSTVLAL